MRSIAAAILCVCVFAATGWSQTPDTILINGKILTGDAQFSIREALSIHNGRILAVGTTADIRKTAGPATRVIDLQRRTVIPGLIDSHQHAIRAGLTFTSEVNWVGVSSLGEGLDRIRQASAAMKPGSWLIVANQSSDSLVMFSIDPQTGRLHANGQSFQIGTPSCVRFLPLH